LANFDRKGASAPFACKENKKRADIAVFELAKSWLREEGEKYLRKEPCSVLSQLPHG